MDTEVALFLADADSTLALGRLLGNMAAGRLDFPALLLLGDLGAGKTTFTRGFVQALPGSQDAEVSSPSFNIMNLYATTPPVAHFDLYRLEGLASDGIFEENTVSGRSLTVIEWAQFLPPAQWPTPALCVSFTPCGKGRTVTLRAADAEAALLLEEMKPHLSQFGLSQGESGT